jgi:transposase
VLTAVNRGMPKEQIAKPFDVSVLTIKRYSIGFRRETGDVQPKPTPRPTSRKEASLEAALPSQLQATPTLCLPNTASCSRKPTASRFRPPP